MIGVTGRSVGYGRGSHSQLGRRHLLTTTNSLTRKQVA
jgi:hypothetical protein